MLQTALEVLLQEAGYSQRRASLMAAWIDQAAIRGMSADDLYSAFTTWKRKSGLSESRLRVITGDLSNGSQPFLEAIKQEVFAQAEESRKYQQLFDFAAQPETLAARTPPQLGTP
jgi:hypothetical protein